MGIGSQRRIIIAQLNGFVLKIVLCPDFLYKALFDKKFKAEFATIKENKL